MRSLPPRSVWPAMLTREQAAGIDSPGGHAHSPVWYLAVVFLPY